MAMVRENVDIWVLLAKALIERIDELERTNAVLVAEKQGVNIVDALKADQRALGKEDTREAVPVPVPSGQDRFGVIYQSHMSRASRIQYFSVEDASAHGLSFNDCHVMAKVIAEALNSQAKSGLFGGGRKSVEYVPPKDAKEGGGNDWTCF
jgi:hypothetical protein